MQESLFLHQWAVWFSFLGGDSKENYHDNFMQAFALRSPYDLAYLWHTAHLSNLEHFLLQPNNIHNSFEVSQERWRKINSVEFFKKGIQPKWEDPKNETGGRFVFPVNKTVQNKDELYKNLVFYLIGEGFQKAEHINGFRFISPKTNQSYYRVEIWVDFNDSDQATLEVFSKLLGELFAALAFDSKIVKFLNNKVEPKPQRYQQKH